MLLNIFIEDIIRLFFEGIFCYYVYSNKIKDSRFQKNNIKKLATFSSVYTCLIVAYRCVFSEYIFYRFISVFIIFIYFLIEDIVKQKRFSNKNWNYILLFSIFISLITECSSTTSYFVNRIAWKWSGVYDLKGTEFILRHVYVVSFLSLHFFCMYLMNKYHFVKVEDIKRLSIRKFVSVLFGFSIFTIIYVKYQAYQVGEEFYVRILSSIFMFLSPTYLSFYKFISKHSMLKINKENLEKEKYITEWVLYSSNQSSELKFLINIGDDSLSFLDRYRYMTFGFTKKLKKLNFNEDCRGFCETLFAIFLTNMLSNHANFTFEKFEKEIFGRTENMFKLSKGTVRKNIAKIIEKTWKLESYETLKKEYYDGSFITVSHNDGMRPPTVEEFLFNISQTCSMSLKDLLSHDRISLPESVHASLVSVQGDGVLLVGDSGIGKTDVALTLIEQTGNYLVADDVVEIRRLDYNVYGSACKESRGFMQVKDVGLLDVKNIYNSVKDFENINLVVHLVSSKKCKIADEDLDLIGERQVFTEIMDIRVPYMRIDVSYGRNIPSIIKAAINENHQRFLNCTSCSTFMERNNMVPQRIKPSYVNIEEYWRCGTSVKHCY